MRISPAVLLIAMAITSCTSSTPATEASLVGDVSLRCGEEYSLEALGRRAFGFDGEVTEIGSEPAEGHAAIDQSVTFTVHEWFVGDGGGTVTVEMMSPRAATSVDNIVFEVGSRLLVSGEPRWGGEPLDAPVAWPCGFSRVHTPDEASQWRDTLNDTSR